MDFSKTIFVFSDLLRAIICNKTLHKSPQWIFQKRFMSFQVFCWTDKWHGMTMEDIRRLEDKTKAELKEQLKTGEVRGTKPI
jgi:hypothetical protein